MIPAKPGQAYGRLVRFFRSTNMVKRRAVILDFEGLRHSGINVCCQGRRCWK
jgi:hypothetical protein